MKTPQDQKNRDVATGALDKNIFVTAGAGTGKTRILIHRLASLILDQNISIDRVVALTFTKKAAEEMRVRLEAHLREIIEHTDNEDIRTRAQTALADIPRAQIGTIHSFASHMLKLFPMQAGVDPKFREDDGSIFEQVFEEQWQGFLIQELTEESPRKDYWQRILQEIDLSDFKELAIEMVQNYIEPKDLKTKVNLSEDLTRCHQELRALMNQIPISSRSKTFSARLEAMARIFDGEPEEGDHSLVQGLSTTILPGDWNEPQIRAQVKQLKARASAFAQVNDQSIHDVLVGIEPFVVAVKKELSRRGVVSFQGLLVLARNLLRDHALVRNVIKNQYDAFLIDEFQDTDPLQGEILFYCTEELNTCQKDWRKVKVEPGKVFVVGDPKQSIYRFRGADMAAYQEFQDQLHQQGAESVDLSTNFRSTEPILTFVNKVFAPIMKPSSFVQPPYISLDAFHNEGDRRDVAIKVFDRAADGQNASAESFRMAEAQWIGQWIEKNVGEKIQYKDIALLFRSTNAFGPYLDVFKKNGIPYLAEGEKYFYKTAEVMDLLNLISVVNNPKDTLSLVGVMRSPLGGLKDKEILALKKSGKLNRWPSPLMKDIWALHEFSQNHPIAVTFDEILKRTWFMELLSQSYYGEQAQANMLKIRGLAEKWNDESPMTWDDFVNRIRKYHVEEKEEGENPLADVKYDAVKVMTIHKSKGLEFPVVFLPNLSSQSRALNQQKPLFLKDWRTQRVGVRLRKRGVINSGMFQVESENQKRELAEEVRVFYVATTRASQKLFMLLHDEERATQGPVSYLRLSKSLDSKGVVEHIRWSDMSEQKKKKKQVSLNKDWNNTSLIQSQRTRLSEFETYQNRSLFESPSKRMNEGEKQYFEDDDAFVHSEKAIQIGLVCHKIMENWDFSSTGILKAAHLFGVKDPETQKEILEIITSFTKSKPFNELSQSKIIGCEIPFVYPTKDATMRGVIDVLFERNGTWVVGDYKTNRVNSKNLKKVAQKYDEQGRIYRTAIQKVLKKSVEFELFFLRTGQSVRI